MTLTDTQLRHLSWTLLGTLLAALLGGTFLYSRVTWPALDAVDLVSGEATYLMQAASLAYDFDLAYSREDFDARVLEWRDEPVDLALASGSRGRRIAFDRPFPYALYLAPFVRLLGENGFAVANALLLTLVALFAARTLERQIGASAPLWVTVVLFASVAWSYVFLATGDLFLWGTVAVAWGLLVRTQGEDMVPRTAWRSWLAAGALLAIPFATEPLYGLLAAAALFAVPKNRKEGLRSAFVLGFAAALTLLVGVQWWTSGGLHFFATTRFRFTPETGFPLVDFTAGDWRTTLRHLQALHWEEAPRFSWGVDPLLWLWDVLYLFAGRNIGLLPYFLPLLALLAGTSLRGHRRALLVAAGLWAAGLVVLHPFQLFGGPGAVGNRLFLPLYGALLFLFDGEGRRPPRSSWTLPLVAVAALFVHPLWASPWGAPADPAGGYRHARAFGARFLPFETSQRWIPDGSTEDHQGLRIRFLDESAWGESRRDRLRLEPGARAEMVVASGVELDSLLLELGPDAPSRIDLRGARLGERTLTADGGVSFELRPGFLVRRHTLWWTPERQWLYCLSFELPQTGEAGETPLAFRLLGLTTTTTP